MATMTRLTEAEEKNTLSSQMSEDHDVWGSKRKRRGGRREGVVSTSLPSHLSILILELIQVVTNNQAVYSRKKVL